MATGILGTAVSGLMAFQRSLDTTSHNIANVNTEGYSRQRVELGTMPAQFTGAGFIGNGVKIENITRSYDQFITNQLRSSASAFGDADRYAKLSAQVDDLLADPTTGMAPAIKSFFNAVNEVANDPSSIPARQVMLSEAEILTQRYSTMNGRFTELRDQVNVDLRVSIDSINAYATEIADLNIRIAADSGRPSNNQLPNDLLDARDRLLAELAEKVDVAVVPADNNMVSVFIGQGQALVLDGTSAQLSLEPATMDPLHLEIGLKLPNTGNQIITRQISGGELAGTLRFRDEVLDPSQQKLGAVAASMVLEFNRLHTDDPANGIHAFDLDGQPGGALFAISSPSVIADPTSGGGGVIAANYDPINVSQLQASDYRLDFDSAGNVYTLTRLSDNQNIPITGFPGTAVNVEGMQISLTTPPGASTSFLIRPSFHAADDINLAINDPRKIAAATNIDADGVSLINGAMPGDNRNALALAALENQLGMKGGNATFSDAYGQMVSEVGTLAHAARVSSSAQETLFNNAKESWSNMSAVNLDEEAANLIKFQQSYQAAAQLISVTNTLFDSLLAGLR